MPILQFSDDNYFRSCWYCQFLINNSVHADSGFMAILFLAPCPHFLAGASNSGPPKTGDEAHSLEKESHPHSAAPVF